MSAVAMTQATPSRAQRARPAGCVGGPPGNISRQDAMAPAALILRLTPPSPRLSPDARRRTHRARDASTTAPAHVARRAPNRGVLAFPRDARRITTAGAIAEPETVEVEVEESSPEPPSEPPSDGFSTVSDPVVSETAMTKKTKAKKASRQITEKARKEKLEMDSDFCRMRTRYDPEAIRKEALATPIALAKRGALVTSKFATLFAKRESMMRADAEDGGLRYATAFKETLTSLGPLFVKLGQNLANRPDLVDEDLMEELTRLQDRVPPFPTEEAFAIMRDEGLEPDNAFSIITPEPVAAASIGQVYKGVLARDGTEVAVKVLRPGTRPQVVLDLFILRAAAERLFDDFARENLGCPATLLVDEFAEKLLEELDFQQEALNLRDFRRNFSDDRSVQIPGVYTDLSSPRVLVMDWQPGVRCTAEGAFESPEALRTFLQNGVESGLRQLLDFGLFHGDPHPGNVLALPSGDIAYVDFGNVAEISRANQESLIDAVVYVMNKDYDNLAACLADLGFLEADSDVQPVAEGLAEVWSADALSNIASSGSFSFRGLTKEFNKLLYKYPIRVPERFSLVIRALLTQENICLTLDPSFNFLNAAFPYVARRLLTDPDPNLRIRLFKVVIVKGKFEWERLRELVKLAETGASGGIKLPIATAVALVTDTTKMLARDSTARNMLLEGLRAVPLREHIAQAASLGAMILGMTVGKWWAKTRVSRAWRKWWVGVSYAVRRALANQTQSDLPGQSGWTPPGDGDGSFNPAPA